MYDTSTGSIHAGAGYRQPAEQGTEGIFRQAATMKERRESTAHTGRTMTSDVPSDGPCHAVGKQESVLNALRLPMLMLSAMYNT